MGSNNEDAKQRVKYFRKAQKTINAINSDSSKSYTAEFNECSMLTEAEKLSFTGLNVSMSRDHEEMKLRKRRRTRPLELRASEKNWYPTHTTPDKRLSTATPLDPSARGAGIALSGVTSKVLADWLHLLTTDIMELKEVASRDLAA